MTSGATAPGPETLEKAALLVMEAMREAAYTIIWRMTDEASDANIRYAICDCTVSVSGRYSSSKLMSTSAAS